MTLDDETATRSDVGTGAPMGPSYGPAPSPRLPGNPADPPSQGRRDRVRPTWVPVAVLLALGVVALAVVTGGLWRAVSRVDDDVAGLRNDVADSAQTQGALDERLGALEAEVGASFDPTEVAEATGPSIFMVASQASEEVVSVGTGFVLGKVERRSLVVTNFHVVERRWRTGATDVLLVRGTREYQATVVEVSPEDDLALLEVAADLPALEPASTPAQIGDPVLVSGAGDGLEGTVTIGVVSAVSRLIEGDDYLQISAQVNPGNSGGPVLDSSGEVIGVVTLKRVALEVEGLAFAIPIDRVCSALDVC